jgi:hypothetical protein
MRCQHMANLAGHDSDCVEVGIGKFRRRKVRCLFDRLTEILDFVDICGNTRVVSSVALLPATKANRDSNVDVRVFLVHIHSLPRG